MSKSDFEIRGPDPSKNDFDPRLYFNGKLRECIDAIPEEILALSETELLKIYKPTRVDWFLRHRFWDLARMAREKGDIEFETKELYQGICSRPSFHTTFLVNPKRLAFLLFPIESETQYAQEVYHYAMLKIRSFILENEISQDNAKEFLNMAKFLAERGYGPMTQRVEAKVLNAKIDLNKQALSPSELEERIRELEAGSGENVIDVSPE